MRDFCKFIYCHLLIFLISRLVNCDITIHQKDDHGVFNRTIFDCIVTEKRISLNCSIKVINHHFGGFVGGCYNYSQRLNLVLSASSFINSFECISGSPLAITFDFDNEKPLQQFTKFKQERIILSADVLNPESKFKIKMVVPESATSDFENQKSSWLTYTLLSLNQSLQIRVYIMSRYAAKYFINLNRLDRIPARPVFFDLSLQNTVIQATEQIIYLPCLSLHKVFPYLVLEGSSDGICRGDKCLHQFIDLNSITTSYNPIEGFRINISTLWNKKGKLLCAGENLKDLTYCNQNDTCIIFELHFPPNVQYKPKKSIQFPVPLNKSATSFLKNENFHLICSSTSSNVTIVQREKNITKTSFKPNYYEVTEPEHRYFTKVNISQLGNKNLKFSCIQSSNENRVIQEWTLYALKETTLNYKREQGRFICNGVVRQPGTRLELRQIECEDIYECLSWKKFLQNQTLSSYNKYEFIPLMKGIQCNNAKNSNGAVCLTTTPIKKAFIQCFHTELETGIKVLPLEEIYFEGFDEKIYTYSDVPIEAILKLVCFTQENYIIVDHNVTCSCEAHSFFYAEGIRWIMEFSNGSMAPIDDDMIDHKELPEFRDLYSPLSIVSIRFKYKTVKSIICIAPSINSKRWDNFTKPIQILDGLVPTIYAAVTKKKAALGEKSSNLRCVSEGRPTPKIEWFRYGNPIEPPLIVISQGDSQLLFFPEYTDNMKGEYLCRSSNTFGIDTKTFSVFTKKDSSGLSTATIISITLTISLLIAVLPIIYLLRRLQKSQELILQLTNEEVDEFFKGGESNREGMGSAFTLPYNDDYELSADSFIINKKQILGSGEFGTVYKGTIVNYKGEFAFKTTRNICSSDALKGLISELKLMIYIGSHENILKLVGAYTKEIQMGILYIATEFCSSGSLHFYLRKNKTYFLENASEFSSTDIFLKFLRWCKEIANGMEYLSSKQVVHSDLAARNVLLNDQEIAKISDFGLSRRMYDYCNYKKTDKTNPLPWKWMAIESLREMTFSTQSDVWAYGVTIWEIFSLGDVPYPGISWTIEFVEMVDQGLRNLRPKYATDKLYYIMMSCWNTKESERPNFRELNYLFGKYIMEECHSSQCSTNFEELYIELN